MKEGLKGDDSPLAKTLDGAATDDEIKKLSELIATLKGTKAPVGDQAAYDEKVEALIKAAEKVAGGSKDEASLKALEKAASCKACHKDHKPKKEKKQ
jgi:cytochrome c553